MNDLLTCLLFAASVFLSGAIPAQAGVLEQTPPKQSPIAVEFFDIIEMPVMVDAAAVSFSDKAQVLKGSAVNRSSESLIGYHFILFIVDSAGKVRSQHSWSERLMLDGVTIRRFSVALPKKLKIKAGERVVMGIDQVIGAKWIWQAVKGEEALRAYCVSGASEMPEVRRVENYVDGVLG